MKVVLNHDIPLFYFESYEGSSASTENLSITTRCNFLNAIVGELELNGLAKKLTIVKLSEFPKQGECSSKYYDATSLSREDFYSSNHRLIRKLSRGCTKQTAKALSDR